MTILKSPITLNHLTIGKQVRNALESGMQWTLNLQVPTTKVQKHEMANVRFQDLAMLALNDLRTYEKQ